MTNATNSTTTKNQALVPFKQEQSLLSKLPMVVILKILHILGRPESISAFGTTCKLYHAASQDNRLWRALFSSRFQTSIPEGTCREERACLKAYQFRANLERGRYVTRELKETFSCTILPIQANGNLIFALKKGPIVVLEIKSGNIIKRLDAGPGEVYSLVWADDSLISRSWCSDQSSGFYDAINVWDLEKGECIKTIKTSGKSSGRISAWANGHLITDQEDTLFIRNFKTNECRKIKWDSQRGCHSFICIAQNLIVADKKGKITIWDYMTSEKKEIILEQATFPTLFQDDGDLMIVYHVKNEKGDLDIKVEKWSLKTSECLEKFTEDQAAAFSNMIRHRGSAEYTNACKVVKLMNEIYFRDKDKLDIVFLTHENLILLERNRDWSYSIKICDFDATDRMIFAEIANLFMSSATFKEAMERFSRMPAQKKQEIYEICRTLVGRYDLTAEIAFLDSHHETRARAIENYLNPPPASIIAKAASAVVSELARVFFWSLRK